MDVKEVSVTWNQAISFTGTNTTGGSIETGSNPDGTLVTPMELVLVGLAGCSGVDVISILNKKRQTPDHFQIKVRGKRASDHPKVYTEIEVEYLFWGSNLIEKDIEQAIALSEHKYCSVGAMLGASAKIHSTYTIIESGQPIS